MKPQYAVIGSGAIGAYYGAMLARAGHDVHFLFHSDYNHVLSHGLKVLSPNGNFHLPHPQAYNTTAQMPPCDIVIVALKSTNQHLLQQLLPPLLKPTTIVLLIQNGIGLEQDLQQQFPHTALAAGLAFICSAKTQPGIVNHQFYGNINIANYSCTDSSVLDSLILDWNLAGIDARLVEYHEARWKKAVWNMPFNGLTVALNTQTDQLLLHPATGQLAYDMMLEVIRAAQALGVHNIDSSFADKMMHMTRKMIPYSPSMKLDFDFHRPMEIHYLYSIPLQLARSAGTPMPKLEMLEAQLRFIQKHYS